MKQDIGRTGSAQIKKVGHTYSGKFGSEPNAKVRGGNEVTEQTFGGK